jgi:hypothetical protein
MIKMAPDCQHLNLIQKVEVFESLLQNTSGHDLRKALCRLKSPSASVSISISISLRRPLQPAAAVGGRAPTPAPGHCGRRTLPRASTCTLCFVQRQAELARAKMHGCCRRARE